MPESTIERWVPITGYLGLYDVSNWGRVRARPRPQRTHAGGRWMSAERILKPGGRDYPMVALTNRRGEVARVYVHRLVLNAFAGPAKGRVGKHRDENHFNNHIDNLYWQPVSPAARRPGRLRSHQAPAQRDVRPLPGEAWRAVAGYEGLYEVSSLGRVRVLARPRQSRSGNWWYSQPQLLRPSRARYQTVALTAVDGRIQRLQVHDLVLTAFVGPAPADHVGRHLDDDRHNNGLANLAWQPRARVRAAHARRRRGLLPPVVPPQTPRPVAHAAY